ncbi:MAG: glutamate-cysteine ligase family protein [Gemmatimonadaceae bacterium]
MSLTEAQLLEDVRQRLFAPTGSTTPRAVGLELELIPIVKSTKKPALPNPTENSSHSTAVILSRLGAHQGWTEMRAGDDPPSWQLRDGARVSFEPGGQIEISTAPHANASSVIDSTRALVKMLRDAMEEEDIELLARGVDPYNGIDAVPLQLHRERYSRMTRYFDSIGPSGVRMMRQTAALQINVERGEDPKFRWRLLNDLAPIMVAIFANSRDYAGYPTKSASYRSELWRTLDPSRTGVVYDDRRFVERYLEFALDAVAMRSGDSARPYLPFRIWMHDPTVTWDDWQFHLSTLFPEVRPKEYFEIRSADTIEPEFLAAPVVFVTGLIYDPESAVTATEMVGLPEPDLLERAGRLGLADPEVWSTAVVLSSLALEGARRLGEAYLSPQHLAEAKHYFTRIWSLHR